jgi:hypothetical protein
MIADMVVIKDRVSALFDQIGSTISLSTAQEVVDLSAKEREQTNSAEHALEDRARDDLLEIPEGFDLVLPDIMPLDDEE